MTRSKNEVGKNIREYLKNNGIARSHIARQCDIPVNAFNMIMNGTRKLETLEYVDICNALNVPLETFIPRSHLSDKKEAK